MKKYILAITALLLVTTPLAINAAPKDHPIFASLEYVESAVEQTASTIQAQLDTLTGRISDLETEVASLEERVSELESDEPNEEYEGFFDGFSGNEIAISKWEVFQNGGNYSVNNGYVDVGGGQGIPFFRSTENPFPTEGTFKLSFGLQYNGVGVSGSGVALSINQQPNTPPGWDNMPIFIWQDSNTGLIIASYGTPVYTITANDDNTYHDYNILYDGSHYYVEVDENLVYTSPSLPRAGGLWFGHPSYTPGNGNWTGFKLDYVKVE